MAEAARALGLKYLGIADHSRVAAYAGGLSADRVRKQWDAIDALNEKLGKKFHVYKGTECDILPDGSLDFDDAADMTKKFEALSAGGGVTMPLQDTFWGARFGMLTDAFGIKWMFNFELKKS
jgi:histidinol phosphatase-like PHP family hydrolase